MPGMFERNIRLWRKSTVSRDRRRARMLRKIAEDIVAQARLDELTGLPADDVATSMMRQWLTFDGHATFLSEEVQVYFLERPVRQQEKVSLTPMPIGDWFRRIMRDWDFGNDQLDGILKQLNLGQSAEIKNRQGVRLRLWVNPKEKSKGIEPVGPTTQPAPPRRDYRKIAQDMLDNTFGEELPAAVRDDLATSLVRQWLTFDGHGLVLTPDSRHFFQLTPRPDGGCSVEVRRESGRRLAQELVACGIAPDAVNEVIHRLNLRQTPEFPDAHGRPCRLSVDPKSGRVRLQRIEVQPPTGCEKGAVADGLRPSAGAPYQ